MNTDISGNQTIYMPKEEGGSVCVCVFTWEKLPVISLFSDDTTFITVPQIYTEVHKQKKVDLKKTQLH